jgi:hypothetical protein
MKTPTIHRNGTAAKDLLEGYCEAMTGLRDAIQALQKAGPNARDYYVQKEHGAFEIARAEHEDRLERMRSVLKEMEALAEFVADHV